MLLQPILQTPYLHHQTLLELILAYLKLLLLLLIFVCCSLLSLGPGGLTRVLRVHHLLLLLEILEGLVYLLLRALGGVDLFYEV